LPSLGLDESARTGFDLLGEESDRPRSSRQMSCSFTVPTLSGRDFAAHCRIRGLEVV
jgi:hypothetical protein